MKKILSIFLTLMLMMLFAGCYSKKNIKENSNKIATTEEVKNTVDEKQEAEEKSKENDNTLEKETSGEANKNENVTIVNDGSESTLKQKVVVIDPGHGKNGNKEMECISPDSKELKIKDPGGAQGVSTQAPEYKVNLEIGLKLQALLEANNVKVVMTKTTDIEDPGNIERAEIANNINADLEIRLHCDSAENQSAHGASMLVPAKVGYAVDISDLSKIYGEIILNSMVAEAGMYNRGISVRSDLTGFNWSKVPIVLVEVGFMSNPEEDRLLSDADYQNKIAQGLCDGIIEALNRNEG